MKPVTFRLMRPSDVPIVQQRHDEQNKHDGTNYPLPRFFEADGSSAPGVVLALVAEREGKVIQGIWYERTTVELMTAGRDPQATAAAWRDIEFMGYELKKQGIQGINCKVPKVVVKSIEKPLKRAGFTNDDKGLAHFYKSLAGGD
jgi:hypothetical protein